MLYSCTHVATVGVKWLTPPYLLLLTRLHQWFPVSIYTCLLFECSSIPFRVPRSVSGTARGYGVMGRQASVSANLLPADEGLGLGTATSPPSTITGRRLSLNLSNNDNAGFKGRVVWTVWVVEWRIRLELASLVYKVLNAGHPHHTLPISYNITSPQGPRVHRSSASHLLSVPRHNFSFGARAFCVAAPKIWNPLHIRQSQTYSSFRRTTFIQPSGPCNAPWFSSETLALYKIKLISYLLTYLLKRLKAVRTFVVVCCNSL